MHLLTAQPGAVQDGETAVDLDHALGHFGRLGLFVLHARLQRPELLEHESGLRWIIGVDRARKAKSYRQQAPRQTGNTTRT